MVPSQLHLTAFHQIKSIIYYSQLIITIKICGQIEFFFISLTSAFLFKIGHDSIAVKAGGSFPYSAQNSSINQTNKE